MSFIIHTEAFNDHKTDLFNATHFQQERRFVWKENSSFSLPSRWIIQFMLCVRQLKVHLCLFFSHMLITGVVFIITSRTWLMTRNDVQILTL